MSQNEHPGGGPNTEYPGGGLNTEHPDANDSPGLLLWRLTNSWQATQRKALQPFELTNVQFVLLATLTWLQSDEPVTQNKLAEAARTDRMMTSQVLRVLEAKGLIERRAHPQDSRARSLSVTDEGRALANRAIVVVEQTDHDFFAPLGEEAADFARMMSRILGSRIER